MTTLWWSMPGPKSFVHSIVDSMREGNSLIITVPREFPLGIKSAIKNEVHEDNYWEWESLYVNDNVITPLRFLCHRYLSDYEPARIYKVTDLLNNSNFQNKIIWLEGINESNFSVWKEFIFEYASIVKNQSKLNRTLFCLTVTCEASEVGKKEIALDIADCNGYVDLLDVMLFVSNRLRGREMNDLKKRLISSVISNIALWDYNLIERFVFEDINNIIDPMGVLLDYAQEKAWMHEQKPVWTNGSIFQFEGENKIHSSLLAASGKQSEIDKRIWLGQIGELFPYIEKARLKVINKLKSSLGVPFENQFGEMITNIYDLEIGHISHQIKTRGVNVNPDIKSLIYKLREMRNCLAHMDPISKDLFFTEYEFDTVSEL